MGVSAQRNIPTLVTIAAEIAKAEGKSLDEKQYITYENIACSFLLRLVFSGNQTHSSTLKKIDPHEKEAMLTQLKARGGQEQ